jgi:hypothetical protein
MSDFLVNLVRRGAGLAAEISPRPAIGLNLSAPLAEGRVDVEENGLESGAGDGGDRTERRETSRSMMIQAYPAPGSPSLAALRGPRVAEPMPRYDPPSSDPVSSSISLQEGASNPSPRPARRVTPRQENDARESRIHGPSTLDSVQDAQRDVSGPQVDTSRRSVENPPAAPAETRERDAFPTRRAESDQRLPRRDSTPAPRSRSDGPLRESARLGEGTARLVPRQEPSWDSGSPQARVSVPQAPPGEEGSITRIQVRIGRIEVRVVRPSVQVASPAHPSDRFAEYALARRCLDRVWY